MTLPSTYERWRSKPSSKSRFGEWYQSVYPMLVEAGFRVSKGDRYLAEDLVQDAIVSFASRQLHERIATEGEATAYLIRSVYNGWIDHLRKHRKETSTALPLEQADLASPQELLAAEEKLENIGKLLKPKDQIILAMMIAGEPLSSIAKLAGLSYSAAGVRVHRIRHVINEL